MGRERSVITEGPIVAVAPLSEQREEQWRHFDNSVNAVSFGFVATAILISMFLIMAIFERFLRPRLSHSSSSGANGSRPDLEAQLGFNAKLHPYRSPKMTIYARGVSVLMPGEEIPTFIAHLVPAPAPTPAPAPAPAPAPCPPERNPWPLHHQPSPCLSPLSGSILS